MIPFVTVADVKTRMALSPNLVGVDPFIQSGITAAYLYVKGEMDSDFDQQVRTEQFYLDESMNGGITPNGFWRLRTVSGLIDLTQPFVVIYSDSWDMSDPVAVPSNQIKIDPQKGVISIPHAPGNFGSRIRSALEEQSGAGLQRGKFVQVTYTAGFIATLNPPPDPLPNPVPDPTYTITPTPPDWLVEAILAYVPAVFEFQQPTNQAAKGEQYKQRSDAVAHVNDVLEDYSRTGLSFYLNPVF